MRNFRGFRSCLMSLRGPGTPRPLADRKATLSHVSQCSNLTMDIFVHFKYLLPRFQKSSPSDCILSDSEALRTHPGLGVVTGHGETMVPMTLQSWRQVRGAGRDSCPLLQHGWRFISSLCPSGVPSSQCTMFIPNYAS